jgi:anti-sigma factor RsiW
MQKFTQEQLMQYLHGEISPILQFAISKALEDDTELQKEIKMLQRTKKQLENLTKKSRQNPNQKTISNILDYARKTARKKAE